MRITVFNGSPRGKKSNTHIMVEEFLKGAQETGAEVENIFLVEKSIKPCQGCFTCWVKTPGICVTRDDMDEMLPKFTDSDIVVFAMPLYIFSVPGIMKNFLDRLIPMADPRFELTEGGTYAHRRRFERVPKFVVISNSGFPGLDNFEALRLTFDKLARASHSEVIAHVYRDAGEILRIDHLLLKALVWQYKGLLRKAGKEVAQDLRLSEDTISRLAKPIVPAQQYARGANESFERLLAKLKN